MPAHKKDVKEKFSPLLSLPPAKLQKINDLIFKENKILKVVNLLQEDYGMFKNYAPSTLRIYLHEYKKVWKESWQQFNIEGSVHVKDKIPEELKVDLPKELAETVKLSQWVPYSRVKVLLQEAVIKFDAMQEMERLAILQYDRVLKGLEYESSLPTEVVNMHGKVEKLSGRDKSLRVEIETLHNMFKDVIHIQMDLGIRHKVEVAQNHLHVNIDQNQQRLLHDFNQMKIVSDVTTQALELLTRRAEVDT